MVRRGDPDLPRASDPQATLLGQQHLYPGCAARLFSTATGWRVVVDDTGIYDVSAQGREIWFSPSPGAAPDFGRAHLLGRVLATTLHFSGLMVLHGSAVAFPQGGVAFLAPKHTGKSTLALALTLSGNRLLSDDTLPVTPGRSPEVWPGVHSMRLLADTALHLTGTLPAEVRADGKLVLGTLPEEQLESQPRPLAAIYVLAAAKAVEGGVAVARRQLPASLAAAVLVGQGKVSEMLGPGAGPELLRRATALVGQVPVYQLPVLQDLSRLPEVVAQLNQWHGTPTPGPARA